MTERSAPRRSYRLRDPAQFVLVAAMIVVTASALSFARIYRYNVVDDAYISFRYAQNWALGRGLVFNPGEVVEGYTNFLWVLVLTPLYALTDALGIDFTRAAITLNIAIALAALVALYAVCRKLLQGDWVATSVVLLLCAFDNAYQAYAISGLENQLLALLLLSAVAVWLHRPRRAHAWVGLLLALASMTRPDAVLAVGAFGLAMASGLIAPAGWRSALPRKELLKRIAVVLGVWALIYGAYFLWRTVHFGSWLPNTFYLKVGSSFDALPRGREYARTFFEDRYYVPLIAFLSMRWASLPVVRWLALYLAAHTAYVIYVGGDFYSGHRFFVVLLPLYYLLVGLVLHRWRQTLHDTRAYQAVARRPLLSALGAAILIAIAGQGLWQFARRSLQRGPYTHEIVRFSHRVDNNVRYNKWLRTFVPPGTTMVVGDIGAAGFFADLHVIDVFGVVDPDVARKQVAGFGEGKPGHEKRATRAELLRREPTLIKWGYIPGDLHRQGYYLFTDFPEPLDIPGLWVRDEVDAAGYIDETRTRFTRAELRDWTATGRAFGQLPARRTPKGQKAIEGHQGTYINTFAPSLGDGATGRLLSPPFAIRGEQMFLRVGGGRDVERLRVSLLVDGRRVATATGHGHDVLGRRRWPLRAYRGRQGQLEIVDEATGPWGHLLVDEIVQWSPPGAPARGGSSGPGDSGDSGR